MVTIVLSLGAGLHLEGGIADFLHDNGIDIDVAKSRWYFEVWNRGDVDEIAAKASFAWHDGNVIAEAVYIEAGYHGLNLEPYLVKLGRGLWQVKHLEEPGC
tara:strand:+ start:225 stop:527 length:303 start_codon:yes stop_codon:yes gene_type:complete